MNNLSIGDLVVPRKKAGLLRENIVAVERQLEAGEEPNLGLIMQKYKETEEDLTELPQFLVQNLRTGRELWYYESDLARIIKQRAAKDE